MKAFHLAKKYLGTRYKLGGEWPDGIDCCSLMASIAREQGLEIPELDAYKRRKELWETDRQSAMKIFIKALYKVANEVPPTSAFLGDILVVQGKDGELGIGIHSGNSTMITVTEQGGCEVVSLVDLKVRKVLRWASD